MKFPSLRDFVDEILIAWGQNNARDGRSYLDLAIGAAFCADGQYYGTEGSCRLSATHRSPKKTIHCILNPECELRSSIAMALPIRLSRSPTAVDHVDEIAIATLYLLVMMIMAVWIRLAFRYYMPRSLQWDDGMVSLALVGTSPLIAFTYPGT